MSKMCNSCGSTDLVVEKKTTTVIINGASMNVEGQVQRCKNCNETTISPVLDSSITKAIKRGTYESNSIRPKDLSKFRHRYQITREELGKATGYQSNQIRRFERGKEAQPEEFRKLVSDLMSIGKNKSEVH